MLSHKLINQIDQLRETFSTQAADERAPIPISAQSDTIRVSVELIDCDRLGYLLTALGAQCIHENTAAEVEIDSAQIEDQIGALLKRITYLTEALTLVEKSKDLDHVLIRSGKPDRREEGIYYYELTLDGGKSIRLDRRYYNFETHRRNAVPFTLSKEVFERLINDLEEILCKHEEYAADLPLCFEDSSIWEAKY